MLKFSIIYEPQIVAGFCGQTCVQVDWGLALAWNAQEIEEQETILSSFYFEFFNLMIRSHSSALLVLSLIISPSSFINISF